MPSATRPAQNSVVLMRSRKAAASLMSRADQQPIAVRDHEQHAAGRMASRHGRSPGNSSWKDSGPGMRRHAGRPAAMLPASGFPSRIGHQIDHAVAAVAGAARRDDLDEAAQTSLRVLLGKPGDLGVERRLGLPLDKIGAGPVDEEQHADHRQREYQEIKRGQPECMRPHQPACRRATAPLRRADIGGDGEADSSTAPSAERVRTDRRGSRLATLSSIAGSTPARAGNSRRRAPCAAAADRNSCRSSAAAG